MVALNLANPLVDEYLWSLAEPATAIFCACAVTYRPLFTTFDFSFLRSISSRLGRSEQASSGQSERERDDPEKNLQYQWFAARGLRSPMIYQDMYAKIAKHDLHVLNVIPKSDASSSTTRKADVSRFDQPVKSKKARRARYKTCAVIKSWEDEAPMDPRVSSTTRKARPKKSKSPSLKQELNQAFEHILTKPRD
ncbi:MAG: hypothetical protein Q9186_002713 [Xanthomendoza sp. 1 TL-2023]